MVEWVSQSWVTYLRFITLNRRIRWIDKSGTRCNWKGHISYVEFWCRSLCTDELKRNYRLNLTGGEINEIDDWPQTVYSIYFALYFHVGTYTQRFSCRNIHTTICSEFLLHPQHLLHPNKFMNLYESTTQERTQKFWQHYLWLRICLSMRRPIVTNNSSRSSCLRCWLLRPCWTCSLNLFS